MHPLPALAVPAAVLLGAAACSFLAPGDADLMGEAAQPATPAGGHDGTGHNANEAGTAALLGGNPPSSSLTTGGEGEMSSGGGGGAADGADFSALIPQDKLALWLMADHGIGTTQAGGGVAVWADHSPNEADAKQSIEGLQPALVPAAGNVPQMLEFDGIDDQLALLHDFSDFSAGLSVFIVASASADLACPSLLQLSNNPEQQDIEVGRFQGSIHYEVQEDQISGSANAFGLNQTVLLGVVHAPNKGPELRLNGIFMATGMFTALPVVTPRLNNFIGRSRDPDCELFHGKIGEIIVYARALDTTERDAVQRYLQGRWNYEPPVKSKPGPGKIPAL